MGRLSIRYRVVLPEHKGSVEDIVRDIHEEAATRAVAAVRGAAPVRTGRFVGQLDVERGESGAVVLSRVPYAVYVRRRKGVWREAQRARAVFSSALTEVIEERGDDIAAAIAADALAPLAGVGNG